MPKETPLRVAVIGCGRIFRKHLEAIESNSAFSLQGVYDSDPVRAKSASEESNTPTFETLESLMAGARPDLVSVLVPSGAHYEIAKKLADYEVPVLVEKPLTLDTKQAQDLVLDFQARGVPLFIVKQNRLNEPVLEARSVLDNQRLGKLLAASASLLWCRPEGYYLQDTWRLSRKMDGGVLWNQASHYVDLLCNFLGEIELVSAFGSNFLSPAETEDTVFAILRTRQGLLGSIQATTAVRPQNFEGSLTLTFERGLLRIGGHALNKIEADTAGVLAGGTESNVSAESSSKADVYGQGHTALYNEVAIDLLDGPESRFRAKNGLQSVAVMESIHKSIDSGLPVRVPTI